MVKNELCYRSRIRILWVLERDEEPFPNCRCVNLMDDSDDTINEAVQAIVGMIL